jgi:hypothetical protein
MPFRSLLFSYSFVRVVFKALGTPLHADRTVKSVLDAVTAFQGAIIKGAADVAFEGAANGIAQMIAK